MKKNLGKILIYLAIIDTFLYQFLKIDMFYILTGINFFDLPLFLYILSLPLFYGFVGTMLVVKDIRKAHIEFWELCKSNWKNIKSVSLAVLIALCIRSFVAEPFNIPSGSMKPNLLVGDFIFVSKWTYGYSKHSLPFSIPLIPVKIFSAIPNRGDVVVFKTPEDNRTDYIKRVIGLPGDKIRITNGHIIINGEMILRKRASDFIDNDNNVSLKRNRKYIEYFNDFQIEVLDIKDNGIVDNTKLYEVPKDHFFVMGDNRDNSQDSRFDDVVGYVPFENLVGKARFVFFSLENSRFLEIWKWPKSIRTERIFKPIK